MQATAVKMSINKTVTLCSLYLPPSMPLDITKLNNLISQLPKPFILIGDFNCHNTLWGCNDTNIKGRKLEEFIFKQDLCLLNEKS